VINISEKQSDIKVYRHELKYYLNKQKAFELIKIISNFMNKDEFNGENGEYFIRSLYFDTYNNLDYYNKLIGVSERKKIRLRIYDFDAKKVKLEIKNRYGPYMMKETVTISSEDATILISGNSNNLLNYQSNITNSIYKLMHHTLYRPTLLVDYEREAYTYPFDNIRITFDKNIRVNNYDFNLFNNKINMTPMLESDVFILEVKYDHMIPSFLLNIISTITAQRSSISKYCLGRLKI
jgi:hypothetical protein